MPLNYNKWDKLEVSDDSDIEGHPNVDHKSLVRWRQRDIHEKREVRKAKIAQLKAEIACNDVLLPRFRTIVEEVYANGPPHFSSIVERLKTQPSPDKPSTNSPKQPTYDEMVLSLLLQVYEEAKKKGVEKNDERLGETLVNGLKAHITKLVEFQEKTEKELEAEEMELAKKITSDDIRDGFDSKYVPPAPDPTPLKSIHPEPKKAAKATTTEFEVLNPEAVEAGVPSSAAAQEDDNALPELTPSLVEFSHLPLRGYEQSFEFIQKHRDVVIAGASDALLVAAFTAQSNGQAKYAQQCVHQSLLIQYCEKLGRDGVGLFFRRMMSGNQQAEGIFTKDVADTYRHLVERVNISKQEATAGEGKEQIQLVAEDPDTTISFIIPDGPPPEDLRLEGPGTEDLDIEEVRKALQHRWDVFQNFPEDFREALKTEKLEDVNKVLGEMPVDEAENLVELLQLAGILNVASGIRDETGKAT